MHDAELATSPGLVRRLLESSRHTIEQVLADG